MIQEYNDTFFSRLDPDIQEALYLSFNKNHIRDKLMLFTKLKYGDEITFKDYHDFPKEIERDLRQMDYEDKSYLFDNKLPKSLFPKKGIILNSESYSGDTDTLLPIVKKFYENMHPDIQIIQKSDKLVQILFKNIDALKAFTNFLYWKVNSLKNI